MVLNLLVRDFHFSNEHSPSLRAGALDVLRQPRLWIPGDDYPDYSDWLEKVDYQLEENHKRAMVAYFGRDAVGTIIYQRHVSQPRTVEIKNISVHPEARGRYIASFLLRNVEIEATGNDFPDCNHIVVDTKTTNADMIRFLTKHKYYILDIDDLYNLGAGNDAILGKTVLSSTLEF